MNVNDADKTHGGAWDGNETAQNVPDDGRLDRVRVRDAYHLVDAKTIGEMLILRPQISKSRLRRWSPEGPRRSLRTLAAATSFIILVHPRENQP